MRLASRLTLFLIVIGAGVAFAGRPRIIKRWFSDAVFLTRLRAVMYSADGESALANLKVGLRTQTRCGTPSCADGDDNLYHLRVACRPTKAGNGEVWGRCVGRVGEGPMTAGWTDTGGLGVSWTVLFDLTFDTGVACHFEGVDDWGFPDQGYVIALQGTYVCENGTGAVVESGPFRMGLGLPVFGAWGAPLQPQRPNRL